MTLVSSPVALTHSILVNLFVKVVLKMFSPTSPAKYSFCPRQFFAYVWLVYLSTEPHHREHKNIILLICLF